MRRRRDESEELPRSHEPAPNVPDLYPDNHFAPEAPYGVNPEETPILSDSPRRALSADRFGKPRKEELRAQPPNSDSISEDEAIDLGDDEELSADFPGRSGWDGPREVVDPEEP